MYEPCVTEADVLALPPTAIPDTDDANRLNAGGEIDIRELRRLAKKQRAMLLGCAQKQPTGGK